MASQVPSSRRERLAIPLRGRLASSGRSFAVIVTELSDDGIAAEGSSLAELRDPFSVEIAFESHADSAWNPKASGPQFMHFFTAAAVRAESRGRDSIGALFTEVAPAARRLLDDFLGQLRGAREARIRGGALPRTPDAFIGRVDETA